MLRKILLVTGKELRASIRDPHVLLFLLFPILVYPAVLIAVVSLLSYQQGRDEAVEWQIAVHAPADVVEALSENSAVGPGDLPALVAGEIDAVVSAEQVGDTLQVTVHQVSTRSRSRSAAGRARAAMREISDARLDALVTELDLDPALLDPVEVERRPRKGQGQLTRWFAAILLSLVVPIGMLISGVYPAVELIVSERERGTLETTLITPIPRLALLTGKVLTCVALMVGSGLANAAALALTANQMVLMLTSRLSALWLPPPSALAAVPGLLGLGLFMAGANLLVVLPARTFKEGEYAASLMMTGMTALILAGFAAAVSGEHTTAWVFLPGANSVIALHQSLMGDIDLLWSTVPALVNAGVGGLLIALAGRVLNREDALFGGWLPAWLAPLRMILPQ